MQKNIAHSNKATMSERRTWDLDFQDERLNEKIGLTREQMEKKMQLQENSAMGGNLYFQLNNMAYHQDQERRRNIVKHKYDKGFSSSVKNHALWYGGERNQYLDARDDVYNQPEGIFRNDKDQMQVSKANKDKVQLRNKSHATSNVERKRQDEQLQRSMEKKERLRMEAEF